MNYFLNYYELVLSRLLSNKTQLYPHQREALLALHQKASRGEMTGTDKKAGLILAGVGTGKTLMETIAPYVLAPWMVGHKVLHLSDNCTLRKRFLEDFPTTDSGLPLYDQWLLYRLSVLLPGVPPPKIVELDTRKFNSYAFLMQDADILVGNRQFLINLVSRGDINPEDIGLIVVDEAHYAAAPSYVTISNYFNRSPISYFTGSKFRSDSRALPLVGYSQRSTKDEFGNVSIEYAPIADYEFTLQDAWKLNPPPIKQIAFKEAHSGKFLVEEDGVEHEYDPEEFKAKAFADRRWFRRILLADNFCLPVLSKAVEILLTKRKATGQPHAMIVRAINIPHVHRIASLLEEKFPHLSGRVGKIHSKKGDYDLQGRPNNIVKRFYDGDLWVLVHCGTIGVGFDHKWASVSCCLCIFKTLSPAEQEWGRIIRKVPGPPPIANLPELEVPNWGVIVTHSALKIKPLFLDFYNGKKSDIIIDTPTDTRTKPVLTAFYSAGETILNLTDTKHLRPGDVLELSILEDLSQSIENNKNENGNGAKDLPNNFVPSSHKENVLDSITDIDPELVRRISEAYAEDIYPEILAEKETNKANLQVPSSDFSLSAKQLPWAKEVEAIAKNLEQIKQTRVYKIQVESVLDNNTVQVVPNWCDIPVGAKLDRTKRTIEEPTANFIDHLNLDWQIMVEGELVSYLDYKKQVILKDKGLQLNDAGEICANGVSLKITLPPLAYDTFLKGLELEIDQTVVEVPHSSTAIARPDLEKKSLSEKYGGQIRGLIYDLLKNCYLIPDGSRGKSLLNNQVKLLTEAEDRVRESGREPNFKNNSQLIHSAVFGHIKDRTGRSFTDHTEKQYIEAKNLVKSYLNELQFQLHKIREQNKKNRDKT